jgi:hypothetical protein
MDPTEYFVLLLVYTPVTDWELYATLLLSIGMADADSVFASNAIEAFALHSHVFLALLQYLGLDIFWWFVVNAGAPRDKEIRFEEGERIIAMKSSLE